MDDYLSKPARLEEIEQAIHRVMSASTPKTQSRERPSSHGVPGNALWDRAAALERLGGDESLLDELVELFFKDYPILARRLTEAAARGVVASLREPAHKLKGSLGALGLPSTAGLAQEIESASEVRDATSAVSLIDRFMAEVEMLQDVMRPNLQDSGVGHD